MVMRGKIVRLSDSGKFISVDPGFHFCFQFFRSVDMNKVTKRCLNAVTLNLSYMWARSLLIYLGLFGRFVCSNVCQEVGTQSVDTVNVKFRIFFEVIFSRLVCVIQYLNTFVVFISSFNFSVSLLHFPF